MLEGAQPASLMSTRLSMTRFKASSNHDGASTRCSASKVTLPAEPGRALQILRISEKTQPATTATYVQRVNLAIDHIVGHLDEPLRLRDLSRVAMLSPFHFHRVFQALVGSTPADFVKRLRLEKALTLMSRTRSRSLTTIALGCGFSSSSDFSRCFKQRFGVPLVVLLTKLDLNSRCVFCKPLPHLVVRPRPLHGAGITMIVFWP